MEEWEEDGWRSGEEDGWRSGEEDGWRSGEEDGWRSGEEDGWRSGEEDGWRMDGAEIIYRGIGNPPTHAYTLYAMHADRAI